MNYNYFSFNNHILSYLIKKLLNVGYQNDIFYRKFKWFVSTLNYDKMLLLYERLLELQEPRIDPGVVRKIMATDMLRYKVESLCIGLDNLLGNKPEEYTLFEKFDFDIITSLMERSEKFIVLLNQFSEKRILGNFEKSFPSFAGINFFNNSLLSQSVNGIV